MTTMAQDANLERCSERIAAAVLEFCRPGRQFQMAELNEYCGERVGNLAPDSPGRILRLLRQAKKVKYRVIDRRNSEYLIEAKSTAPVPARANSQPATLFSMEGEHRDLG
jgi:hypothetical protein